jgi:hypothetical protein
MKKCNKCNVEKPLNEFSKCKTCKDGLQYSCKECKNSYRKENLNKIKEYNKQWRENNPEYMEKYNLENKDKIRKQQKQYWKKNNNKIKLKRKKYNLKNKDKINKYQKNYSKENKDKIRKRINNYVRKRYSTDIEFRLHYLLRNRIYTAIRDYKFNKKDSSIEELGCSIEEYVLHLESQFTDKMNWDNHGTYWEIDHIHPISKGGSFHYTNTQPLTIEENRKKSNKII